MTALRRTPSSTLRIALYSTILSLGGCQQTDEDAAKDAVIAAAGNYDGLKFHKLRSAQPLRLPSTDGEPKRQALGAGICGELKGHGGGERYFIWEKDSGDVFLADESGVIRLDDGGLMWKQYCGTE